jgi:uncharacterized protein (DUF58 family)
VLRQLAHIELRARLLVEGMYASRHRSPHYGYSVEFKDHREYVVGDEPRNIDWKMLARTERYYVKRFEMESNMDVISIIDTSASMVYVPDTSKRLSKMEYACYLAASLSYLANRQQDAPGIITFDHELQLFIGPRQGVHHLHTLLARLEALQPSRSTDLGAVLRRIGQRLKRRSLLILISDCHSEEADVRDGIRLLAARGHDVVVMHLLDHDEIEFPFHALAAFADIESGGQVMCDPLRQRNADRRRLRAFRDSIMDATVGCGADSRFIDTAEPIEIVLRDYLLYRRQRG